MIKTFYISLIICVSINAGIGQVNKLIVKSVILDSCIINIDTNILIPSSVQLDINVPYKVMGRQLIFDCNTFEAVEGRKVNISYRTLMLDLTSPVFFLDTTQLKQRENAVYIGYDYSPYASSARPLIDKNALNYSGSLSRGFSVGNSQSLVLNSNLNLQLNGNLGNGINVVAAISDDNIPIQADGNTQLLQEFDKVFIKVSKDRTGVIAGDYDLRPPKGYFINYFKKVQGLRLDNNYQLDSNSSISSSANFSISRGKFARQTLEVREGNQGPYKLRGNNGERFIIALQGSEKVYYDGQLLLRGLDNDYVIDYNNAEIRFTQNKIVTREARIIVEYEYTDQNYLRSLYAVNTTLETKKYSLSLNFYNEQDSKNATGQIELDSTDIQLLTDASEDPSALLRSGIRRLDPSLPTENSIFYKYTIDPETRDSILLYTKDIEEAEVTAVFSEVGASQGDYLIDNEAGANGRVYKYVGQGMGNYLPVIQLIAPEKRQMMALSAGIKINERSSVNGELSFSNFDNNRFSSLDNSGNHGVGYLLGYEIRDNKKQDGWQQSGSINYEFTQDNFRTLNPYRPPEFSRDWNISQLDNADQHIVNANIALRKNQRFNSSYRFSMYNRQSQYTGHRHNPQLTYRDSLNTFIFSTDMLFSDGLLENTRFSKPIIDVSRVFPWLRNWAVRVKYLGESNNRKNAVTDNLLASSFAFDELYLYLDSPKNATNTYSFYTKRRQDKLPLNNALVKATSITEFGINGLFQGNNSGITWNINYRDFNVDQAELIQETNTSTLLGRVDYRLTAFDGFINMVSTYNLGSGQEAKREYQFVKVEKGEGNYIYLGDLNDDGEDQINEYEVAVFGDQADFIRVNIINNEFIRTDNKGFNQSLRLAPGKVLGSRKSNIAKFLAKINTATIIRVDQKINAAGDNGISPFNFSPKDTSLVSYNSLINNTLFFNRGNPNYDLQIGNRSTNNRFVQITGFEQRSTGEYFFRSRFNPKSYLDIITNIEFGKQEYDSEFFDNKDLDVDFVSINPKINYRPKNNLRLSLQYTYEEKSQLINEQEEVLSHDLTVETTWRQASKNSLVFSLSLVDINYTGQVNTPVAYNLLSGLNKGSNYLWSVNFTKRLSGNLDLNINYNGRKTGDTPSVHVARAQVRANF